MSKGVNNIDSARYSRRKLEEAQKELKALNAELLKYKVQNQGLKDKVYNQAVKLNGLDLSLTGYKYRVDSYNVKYESLPTIVRFFVPKSLRKV